VPDTLVLNDIDCNYWVYTDTNGNVCRTENYTDNDLLDKFKSTTNDENELLAVYKEPNTQDNHLELLNIEELERYLFSKQNRKIII
jgi:hypothetical protein